MKKFLSLEELSRFCQQNNLQTKVKSAKNVDKALAIIKEALPEGKSASEVTVRAYRNELKTLQLNNETSNPNPVDTTLTRDNDASTNTLESEVVPPPGQDAPIAAGSQAESPEAKNTLHIDTLEKTNEEPPKEDNRNIDSPKSPAENKISTSQAESKKLDSKKLEPKVTEKITATVEGEKESVYVDKDRIKELDEARYIIKEHEKDIKLLNSQLEELRQKLNTTSTEPEKKNTFLSQIPNLNELLNSGSEKITVSINKDLLSKATRFVDANSLIRLESIIQGGYDINSTVVQSILLAFIYQNSLI